MKRRDSFWVLGEGIAAGVGHFHLSSEAQRFSFPALAAGQRDLPFHQPLLQPPGLGDIPGMVSLPVIAPDLHQTTVIEDLGCTPVYRNLSIPGMTVADALSLRSRSPIVHQADHKQTLANLIFGMKSIVGKARTAVEIIQEDEARTIVLVALGFAEVIQSAVDGLATPLPDVSRWADQYGQVVDAVLAANGTTVLATIPDPLDTAYFSSMSTAARILNTESAYLTSKYGLRADTFITLPGLIEIGCHFRARAPGSPLPANATLEAATASALAARVHEFNDAIRKVAAARGSKVLDLHAIYHRAATRGIGVAPHELHGHYLGRFFSLNGIFPGKTGQAHLANALLEVLDQADGGVTPPVDLEAVARVDESMSDRLLDAGRFTREFERPWSDADLPVSLRPGRKGDFARRVAAFMLWHPVARGLAKAARKFCKAVPAPPEREWPIQTIYPDTTQPEKKGKTPLFGVPSYGMPTSSQKTRLRLPEAMEQTLDLNPAESWFGDALRVVDAPDDTPYLKDVPAFGHSSNTYFGGLAMVDTTLRGRLHLKFFPPGPNGRARFELRQPGMLIGDDARLEAPQLFKLPMQLCRVMDVPDLVSWGEIDLDTGIAWHVHYSAIFYNTAVITLFGANPKLDVIPLMFPGPPNAGSTSATFSSRDDGLLDLTLDANMFIPLGTDLRGDPVRWPMPFTTPDGKTASILTRCASLHPNIRLTTRASDPVPSESSGQPSLDLKPNSVIELTALSRNTTFGDDFHLNMDALGGPMVGRAHLQGRMRLQLGPPVGQSDLLPISVRVLKPGGLFSTERAHMPFVPPGCSLGMPAPREQLKAPSGVVYDLRDISYVDDGYNLSLGCVNRHTGRVIGPLLHRGYVSQAMLQKLVDTELGTPADSFAYRGPARLERGRGGELVYRFKGDLYIPYPTGLLWPKPTELGGFPAKDGSFLVPFMRLRGATPLPCPEGLRGKADQVTTTIGEKISYRFDLPGDPERGEAIFEFHHHDQEASFHLVELVWIAYISAQEGSAGPDSVALTGLGTWSGDPDGKLHFLSAFMREADGESYFNILIDGGATSCAHLRPELEDSLP